MMDFVDRAIERQVVESLSRGNYNAIEDIKPIRTFVAAPVVNGWALKPEIDVVSLAELVSKIRELLN